MHVVKVSYNGNIETIDINKLNSHFTKHLEKYGYYSFTYSEKYYINMDFHFDGDWINILYDIKSELRSKKLNELL